MTIWRAKGSFHGNYMILATFRPTHLPSLSEHEDVISSPTPSPVQSHHTTMTRPVSGRSAQSTLLQTDPEELWVEMNRNSAVNIEVTTNHDPFDVYIDEVRFIPDNATAVKVSTSYFLWRSIIWT